MLTYRAADAADDAPVMQCWRGAVDPTTTEWVTDDPDAASAYGPAHEIRLVGRIASPNKYRVLDGYDPKSDAPELNFDAIADAYADGFVAIGPIEDIDVNDRPHRSWVVVGDIVENTGI